MSTAPHPGRQEAAGEDPTRPRTETFREELAEAIAPRTLVVVVGVALLCMGFVLSYLGAFHTPSPHRIPVAVVAPAQVADQFVVALNGIDGDPLAATAVADEATARQQLADGKTTAVLVVDPTGGTADTLLVATGGGASLATATQRVLTAAEATQGRTITVTDAVPAQTGDPQGTTAFYVVIGAVLAGYLLAAVLGMAKGARPATFRRTLWRLGATVPYAVVVGLGIAVITGPVLSAVTGHFALVWGLSTLLVVTAATVTMAFQILFGFVGIGVTILVFVIIGNASAGGALPYPLLPTFWRTVGPALPNGAGVEVVRRAVYFGGAGISGPLLTILGWAVVGTASAVVASRLGHRSPARSAASPVAS